MVQNRKIIVKKFGLDVDGMFSETYARRKFAMFPKKIGDRKVWWDYYYKVTTHYEPYSMVDAEMGHSEHQYFTEYDFTVYLLKEAK